MAKRSPLAAARGALLSMVLLMVVMAAGIFGSTYSGGSWVVDVIAFLDGKRRNQHAHECDGRHDGERQTNGVHTPQARHETSPNHQIGRAHV